MKYKDFDETEQGNLNLIWTLKQSGNGLKYEKTKLENIIGGDSDSCFVTLKPFLEKKNISEKSFDVDSGCTVADRIAKNVNSTFPDFVMQAFNCPEERKNIISTDREVVYDGAWLLSKKRYIMHIVDKEGKRVDELKIMGVELKKSNTSPAVKVILKVLVDMILDGCEMEEVLEKIDDMKKEFFTKSFFDIASPISCKTLNACVEQFETTGSMKGIPYQVKAAMTYNRLRGDSDRPIAAGDKILLLYTRSMEADTIAIPQDLNEVPKFVEQIPIDYNINWDKAHKKIVNYLETLGWDIESRKRKLKESLFGF